MFCNGTVVFRLNYFGTSTTVEALVSSDLEDEVLLGWQTLKCLKIIHEDFPKPLNFGQSVTENVKQRTLHTESPPLGKTMVSEDIFNKKSLPWKLSKIQCRNSNGVFS